MATDTENKPALTDSDPSPAAKVGDGGRIPHVRKLSIPVKNKKKTAAYLILAIVILIGVWIVLKQVFHVGDKIYAQAAGHKVYKRDVDNLINGQKGISERAAATVLADQYLTQALAKEQGIKVTPQDIQAQYGSNVNLSQQKTANPYNYQSNVNGAYFVKLQSYFQGNYKGFVLVAQFSRYIPSGPVSARLKAELPQMGDPSAIAADKQYAKNFITNLYNQIQAGKITWNQAAQMEHNDRTLGVLAYPSLSHSGPFDTANNNPQPLFIAADAQAIVSRLKSGQTSKPFVVSVYNPATKKSFDSYYLVVRMDSKSGGTAYGGFQDYLLKAEQRLDYKVYVKA